MSKKIFISLISGGKSKSNVNKEFSEDLKYSMSLKFNEDQAAISGVESESEFKVFIIPDGKKIEKIQPDSKNFYVNFNPEQEAIRNRFYYDLSLHKNDENEEQFDRDYWNVITDILFQLEDNKEKKNGQKVYVAETSADQMENRRSIVRELEQKGFQIYPDHSIVSDFKKEVIYFLNKSDFSVHIVGSEEAPLNSGDTDLVFLQNEIASAHSSKNKDFKRYIYIPSNLSPGKGQQIKIEKVKRKPDNLIGAEIIECGIEKFKSELFQKIERKERKDEVVDMHGNLIYIINGINFKSETKSIRQKLEDASIDLVAIDSFDDSLDFLHQHKKNLLKASSVLIVNTEDNNHWMSSMLDDILKSYGLGKQRPFDLVGVITEKKLQYFSQLELIRFTEFEDSPNEPSTENLKAFLKAVKDARD